VGGAMLVGLGLLLVTGVWTEIVSSLQSWISGFEVAV
jgi:cytochrome c-type biogenesis protein